MKDFLGPFEKEMNTYINIQKNAGKYIAHIENTLSSLDAFLTASGKKCKELSLEDIDCWKQTLTCGTATKNKKYSALKGFIKYLRSCDIPCASLELPRKHGTSYIPYVYSENEWSKIIQASDNLQSALKRLGSNVPIVFPVLIRLLYSCGLRLNEALSIRICDIDFDEGVLTIYKAKFRKQRLVPMSPSMTEILYSYCIRLGIKQILESYVFIGPDKRPYSVSWCERWFSVVLDEAGVKYQKKNPSDRGPCLHCLRHVFVFRSFRQAESRGNSLTDSVPFLSTYLGHKDIMETDRYLKFSYELYPDAHDTISDFIEDVFPEVE